MDEVGDDWKGETEWGEHLLHSAVATPTLSFPFWFVLLLLTEPPPPREPDTHSTHPHTLIQTDTHSPSHSINLSPPR